MAWRFATWPTSRSPSFVYATSLGVRREPSSFVMTTASFPSITATTEFVVPRSMPMILAIGLQILLTGGNVRRRPDLSNADLADPGGLLRSRPAAPRATRPRVGLPLAPRPVQV